MCLPCKKICKNDRLYHKTHPGEPLIIFEHRRKNKTIPIDEKIIFYFDKTILFYQSTYDLPVFIDIEAMWNDAYIIGWDYGDVSHSISEN